MGKRGPSPQPIAILKAKGTLNVTRANDPIATMSDKLRFVYNELPQPPEHLPEKAQEIWTMQLSQAMKLYGYISFIDLVLFSEYCYVYAEIEHLKSSSRYYTDDNGIKRVDPMYQELNKLRKDFIRLSQEFGFSPSARTRIVLQNLPDEKKEDDYQM